MPAARGVKRTASKSSATAAPAGPKNKKKRGAIQLEIPTVPKKRGCVFVCGQGDFGQLGIENVEETNKFKKVSALGDKVVDVIAGGVHTVALDSDGKVWTFGCNDEGALGRPASNEAEEFKPTAVVLPRKAVAITAGASHSAALLEDGAVYAWGAFRDSHGTMGLVVRGREGKSCREPTRVDVGEPAVAIASGDDHLVVLSTSGAVYTMGCAEQGQLGRLPQRSATRETRQGFSPLLIPSKVTLKGGASRIWAGYFATFALDANNDRIFAWGLNNYGQLGITSQKNKLIIFSPTECDVFTRLNVTWQHVVCGQHHTLALDTNGTVYALGRYEYGRLGLGENSGEAETLEPIPKLQNKRCVSIAAGSNNSFAVTDVGEVFSWGMGSDSLGTGTDCDAFEPISVNITFDGRPSRVSAGGQHTALLLETTKETTAAPENEKEEVEQNEEEMEEDEPEPEKEKEKGKAKGRPIKDDQDEEISSTSSAQPSEAAEQNKPQKVNGDEKKETPMEVDEIDKPDNKKDETETDKHSEDTEPETEPEVEPEVESKPDTIDTSSQETTDSESKPPDTQEPEPEPVAERTETGDVNGKVAEVPVIPDTALTSSA